MSIKRIVTAVGVVLLLPAFSLAQSQSSQAPASSAAQDRTSKEKKASGDDRVTTIVFPSGVAQLAVPDGEGAWSVQINFGGGFAGTNSDRITVTSTGSFACYRTKSS